ncbi:MAG: hypothetical protein ABIV06_03140, partial [Thermoanaerobaculia bacterium]
MNVAKNALDFNLFPIDDDRRLFISPAIRDWSSLEPEGVRVVIDLEGGIDYGVPVLPNHTLYLYFPIFDEALPCLHRLHGIASLGA